jgi:hypothetical protein
VIKLGCEKEGLSSGLKKFQKNILDIFIVRIHIISSIDFDWFTHGGFNVQRSHIIPAFLQKGHQEVDGCTQILSQLIFSHFVGTEGCSQ